MSFLKKIKVFSLVLVVFLVAPSVHAATSPGLGQADTFSILSSSYVNTAIGTTINGDLGYTTGPVVAPTVNGTTHVVDNVYNQAGIDQGTALAALNNQPCDFTYASGAIDLASDTTFGPAGSFGPGVYCVDGAASIGGGTITLTGTGTYIFRMDGALTTSADSIVVLADGASACDIWWTPTSATTLGANSTFMGTDISAAGITIGSNVTWTGRALAFGGTVSTTSDTINTIPDCAAVTNSDTTLPTTTPTPVSETDAERAARLANTGSPYNSYLIAAIALLTICGAISLRSLRSTSNK